MSNKSGSSLVVVRCFCGHGFKVGPRRARGVFDCPSCGMHLAIWGRWLVGQGQLTKDELVNDESAETRLGVA